MSATTCLSSSAEVVDICASKKPRQVLGVLGRCIDEPALEGSVYWLEVSSL